MCGQQYLDSVCGAVFVRLKAQCVCVSLWNDAVFYSLNVNVWLCAKSVTLHGWVTVLRTCACVFL